MCGDAIFDRNTIQNPVKLVYCCITPHIRLVFYVKNQALLARVQHFTNLSNSCSARTICFTAVYVLVLVHIYYYYYCSMQYNMYHKRPLDAQNAQPIPMPEGGRSKRPKAGSRPPQGMGIAGPFWRALLSHRRGHNGS